MDRSLFNTGSIFTFTFEGLSFFQWLPFIPDFHLCLSFQPPSSSSRSSIIRDIPDLHGVLGRLRFLLPAGDHCNCIFGHLFSSILLTRPYHWSCRFSTLSFTDSSIFIILLISSFLLFSNLDILAPLLIPSIHFNCLYLTNRLQPSAPYVNILSTLA